MTDATLNRFLASGTAVERGAFTPDPPTPASGPDPLYLWLETDTGALYWWNGSAWVVTGPTPVTTQTGTTYTAVLADANTYIRFNNASSITFTIPPNTSEAFPVGTVIEMEQAGAGALGVVAGAGVTVNSRGPDLTLAGQYAVAAVKKVATNTWTLFGDL
jgi:hypothetical protein